MLVCWSESKKNAIQDREKKPMQEFKEEREKGIEVKRWWIETRTKQIAAEEGSVDFKCSMGGLQTLKNGTS